jgi:outer membrane protein TolC
MRAEGGTVTQIGIEKSKELIDSISEFAQVHSAEAATEIEIIDTNQAIEAAQSELTQIEKDYEVSRENIEELKNREAELIRDIDEIQRALS